jgi:hypothetical protein
MHIRPHMLALAAGCCVALPACEGCGHSDPAEKKPPVLEIRWKGEDTDYRGKTAIQAEGKPRHEWRRAC